MNRKGSVAVIILLIIVIVLIAGGIWYVEAHKVAIYQPSDIQTLTVAQPAAANTSTNPMVQADLNPAYGIKFQYSASGDISADDAGSYNPYNNSPDDSIFLEGINISPFGSGDYPNYEPWILLGRYTVGGNLFGIKVAPSVTSASSCYKFGSTPTQIIDGNLYSEDSGYDGTAGTLIYTYDFYTFKNGLCYDLALYDQTGATNPDDGFPEPGPIEQSHVDEIFPNISFVAPVNSLASGGTIPAVTSFTVAQTSDYSFSWTTMGADSVLLSAACATSTLAELQAQAQTSSSIEYYCSMQSNGINILQPANGSKEVVLDNTGHPTVPMSLIMTLIPVLNGIAYPSSSRSVNITIP